MSYTEWRRPSLRSEDDPLVMGTLVRQRFLGRLRPSLGPIGLVVAAVPGNETRHPPNRRYHVWFGEGSMFPAHRLGIIYERNLFTAKVHG